jgi:hypothetical protein
MTGFASAFHDYQQERRHSTGIRNRKPTEKEARRVQAGTTGPRQRRSLGGDENGSRANRR